MACGSSTGRPLTDFGRGRPNLPLPLERGKNGGSSQGWTSHTRPSGFAKVSLERGENGGPSKGLALRTRRSDYATVSGEGKERRPRRSGFNAQRWSPSARQKDDGSFRGIESNQSDPPPRAWWRCLGRRTPGSRMCSGGQAHVFTFSGDVFSFWGDVFSLAANVFSFRGDVFSLAANVFSEEGERGERRGVRVGVGGWGSGGEGRRGFPPSAGAGQVSGDAGMTGMCPLCQANVSRFLRDVSSSWPDV